MEAVGAAGAPMLDSSAVTGERAGDVPDASEPRLTLGEIYERHFPFVWRTARRLGAPESALDDVTQDVFLVVWRRYEEFEGRAALKTWLFAIVRNIVRAHRRTLQKPDAATAAQELDEIADSASDHRARQLEAERFVNRVLDHLDDDKREVFVLAELEQMTAPEIAGLIGIPLNTVYSRLRLARQEFAAVAARDRARDDWRSK
jgi:RNA polymerase sigma-70 factor (ECF subfamily)